MNRIEIIKANLDKFKAITDDIAHLRVINDKENIQKRVKELSEVKKSLDRDFKFIDYTFDAFIFSNKG